MKGDGVNCQGMLRLRRAITALLSLVVTFLILQWVFSHESDLSKPGFVSKTFSSPEKDGLFVQTTTAAILSTGIAGSAENVSQEIESQEGERAIFEELLQTNSENLKLEVLIERKTKMGKIEEILMKTSLGEVKKVKVFAKITGEKLQNATITDGNKMFTDEANTTLTTTKCTALNVTNEVFDEYIRLGHSIDSLTTNNTPLILTQGYESTGMGNHLFMYAGLIGISLANEMRPVIFSANSKIKPHFRISAAMITAKDFDKFSKSKEVHAISETAFGKFAKDLTNISVSDSSKVKVIKLTNYLQSWKYFHPNCSHIIRSEFQLNAGLRDKAQQFLGNSVTKSGEMQVFVGVHTRRGDILNAHARKYGYQTADKPYYLQAMDVMARRYNEKHVVFVVCGNDAGWNKKNLAGNKFKVVFCPSGQSAVQDFAVLASCNHTVMSVGTFGWWAAYLAGGDVIYYEKSAKPGSPFQQGFDSKDFFPPHWQPLS